MSVTLTLHGTFQAAEEPGTYVDKATSEVLTRKRQTIIMLMPEGRTIDVEASTDTAFPDSGTPCTFVVEVGGKIVNFGKAAEATFSLRSLTAASSKGRRAA